MASFERPSWDEYFMLQAELAKLRSNCIVRKVGAVIAKNHRQLATGYNGTPPGITNCYEGGCERCAKRKAGLLGSSQDLDRCVCSHAEANAIIHCAIFGIGAINGATLYSTLAPCLECAKMAITVGVKRFVYMANYPESSRELMSDARVEAVRMDRSRIERWAETLASGYGG